METGTISPEWVTKKLRIVNQALQKNLAAREKHAGFPKNFLDSEVALDDAIGELGQISANVAGIKTFTDTGGLSALASIISTHPNPDVAQTAMGTIGEILDPENFGVDDARLRTAIAIELLQTLDFFELVPTHLSRFEGQEEADLEAVASTFQTVSHTLNLDLEIGATALLSCNALVSSLLARTRAFDETALYAVDILGDTTSYLYTSESDDTRGLIQKYLELSEMFTLELFQERLSPKRYENTEAEEVMLTLADGLARCYERGRSADLNRCMDVVMKCWHASSSTYQSIACKLLPPLLRNCRSTCDRFVAEKGLKRILGALEKCKLDDLDQATPVLEILASLVKNCSPDTHQRVCRKLVADGGLGYHLLFDTFRELYGKLCSMENEIIGDLETPTTRVDWSLPDGMKQASVESQALELHLYESHVDILFTLSQLVSIALSLLDPKNVDIAPGIHYYMDQQLEQYSALQVIGRKLAYFQNDTEMAETLDAGISQHADLVKKAEQIHEDMQKQMTEEEKEAALRERERKTERNREMRQKHKIRRLDAEMRKLQSIEDARYARKKQR